MSPFKLAASTIAESLKANREALEKKAVELWDMYGKPYDLPGIPDAAVDPVIRSLIVKLAGPAIDALAAKLTSYAQADQVTA